MQPKNYQSVHNLIAILDDSENGFLTASEYINDEVLSTLFENYGYQRGVYKAELKKVVEQNDIISSVDSITLGLLNRTWKEMKTYFKYGKNSLLLVCIKAEEVAYEAYQKIINEIADDNCEIKKILQTQLNGIKSVLNFIKLYTGFNTQKC